MGFTLKSPHFVLHEHLALFWFANLRLLSEFSTPFVNCRWILNQLDMRETNIYQFNRQATFYAFVIFRILPIPFYWAAALYNVRQPGIEKLDLPLKMILLISGVALDCLNVNWCLKLSKGI